MRIYRRLACLAALLAVLLAAGCVSPQNASVPAASPSVGSPTPSAAQYEADPMAWLQKKAADSTVRQTLGRAEIDQIGVLAYFVANIPPFFHVKDLSKQDALLPLYLYYRDAASFDRYDNAWEIHPYLAYLPDGVNQDGGYVYLTAEKAAAFIGNVLGADIPDRYVDWSNPGRVSCINGAYQIPQSGPQGLILSLRAYQYLGDGLFYVSLDADDKGTVDPGDEQGNKPDYCRLLVVRSQSAWGFTVRAKLKEGNQSLLHADFPLPLYAAS